VLREAKEKGAEENGARIEGSRLLFSPWLVPMTISKDQERPWIRGGPLLEVSFLKELGISRQDFIEQIFTGLRNLSLPIEMVETGIEYAKLKEEFLKGYPFDEKDPKSINVHSISILYLLTFISKTKKERRISGYNKFLKILLTLPLTSLALCMTP